MQPTALDEGRLAQRVAGRELANEIIELAAVSKQHPQFEEAFWDQLSKLVTANAPERKQERAANEISPMEYGEAMEFEAKQIGFGKHAELTYGDAPINYLEFIGDRSIELLRYLMSSVGRRRIEAGE